MSDRNNDNRVGIAPIDYGIRKAGDKHATAR